ncbi:MAG: ABC transporter ATP-binding protein [Colwellia sp.]|nr:ABC transporter ATP-binding protein [Colwellia sp.]MCW8863992.1 ABC transporter ATP-binding protein [Colwellia sp.]MCW9080069.1 ABC transporter ATP-binding protein [Colwellia sp.]
MSIQLQVDQLHWQINDKVILNNISFKVSKGEVIGIIGPNGAGKTSLLNSITKQVKNSANSKLTGTIHLKNKELKQYTSKQLAQHFALVAQKSEPIFSLTVTDIVKLGLLPHQGLFTLDSDHDKEQVKLALSKVGLANSSEKSFNQLSGGEQQRVLIARALVQRAQILILDEPTNHLDVFYQHQILQLVKQLKITVIMTVHDLNLASQYCQRLLLLNQGELICDGNPDEVLSKENLQQIFKLPCLLERDPFTHTPRVYFSPPHQEDEYKSSGANNG